MFGNKKIKFGNPKCGNFTFIINKNQTKTRTQPILKSNSAAFMFNNIFCEMKGKKSYPLGGVMEEPS